MSESHYNQAQLATLMDIRDELQRLNRLFSCSNFMRVPTTLSDIERNTKVRKYHRKVPK